MARADHIRPYTRSKFSELFDVGYMLGYMLLRTLPYGTHHIGVPQKTGRMDGQLKLECQGALARSARFLLPQTTLELKVRTCMHAVYLSLRL